MKYGPTRRMETIKRNSEKKSTNFLKITCFSTGRKLTLLAVARWLTKRGFVSIALLLRVSGFMGF